MLSVRQCCLINNLAKVTHVEKKKGKPLKNILLKNILNGRVINAKG